MLDSGATGLVPISSLNTLAPAAEAPEFWMHDVAAQALVGQRSRGLYRLTARVDVRLVEAAPLTGGLLFAMLSPPEPPASASVSASVSAPGPVPGGAARRLAGRGQAPGARGRGKPTP